VRPGPNQLPSFQRRPSLSAYRPTPPPRDLPPVSPLRAPLPYPIAASPPFTAARKCLPRPSTPSKPPGPAPTNAHAPKYSSCACRPCLCSIVAAWSIRFALQSQTPATNTPTSDSPGRAMPPHLHRPLRLARSASMQGQPRDLRLQRTMRIALSRPLCNLKMPERSVSQC